MEKIPVGDRFPDIEAPAVNGGVRRLPSELTRRRTVLVFYRGHW